MVLSQILVPVASSSPSPLVLEKLFPKALLDREFAGRHRAERVLNAEVPYVRYRGSVKTYDYISRVFITLPLTIYEDM